MAARYLSQISEIVKKIDHDGDAITYSKQTQYVGQYMVEACQSDEDVRAMFQHLNKLALASEDVAINLARVLTNRQMEAIRFHNSQTTVRNEVLRVLQGNFASEYIFIYQIPMLPPPILLAL